MILEKLSDNGYRVKTALSDDLYKTVYELCKTSDMELHNDGREKYNIDSLLRETLESHFQQTLESLTDNFTGITAIELWRDPPGYNNDYHYDDPAVRNIMIVYLETNSDPNLGTGYIEHNGTKFQEVYSANNGIIVLGSNKIKHGMVGSVPPNTTRYTMYVNWK